MYKVLFSLLFYSNSIYKPVTTSTHPPHHTTSTPPRTSTSTEADAMAFPSRLTARRLPPRPAGAAGAAASARPPRPAPPQRGISRPPPWHPGSPRRATAAPPPAQIQYRYRCILRREREPLAGWPVHAYPRAASRHLHARGQPLRAAQRRRRQRVARLGAARVRRGVELLGVTHGGHGQRT